MPTGFIEKSPNTCLNHFLIEDALYACRQYLSRVVPADLLVLQYTNIEAGTHRIVATATGEKGKRWNTSIPFSPLGQEKSGGTDKTGA